MQAMLMLALFVSTIAALTAVVLSSDDGPDGFSKA
jgi:hypothetical protein